MSSHPETGKEKAGKAPARDKGLPRRGAVAGRDLLRWLPLALVAFAIALVFAFDLPGYLNFEEFAAQRVWLEQQVDSHGVLAICAFIAVYALAVLLLMPAVSLLTVLGGFLFGPLPATAYVVVGANIGAALLFLAARTALGNALRRKAGGRLDQLRAGFRENAFNYLLVLRLIPLFPFWLINLVPAFLGVRLRTFVLATALGIIPGTFVYASLGNGLGEVLAAGENPDLTVIFRPEVFLPLIGLAVLALLPVAYKTWRRRAAKGGQR